MKNYQLIGLYISLLFSTLCTLSAQWALPKPTEESNELVHIKTAYAQAGQVSCTMAYKLFGPSDAVAADSMVGTLTMYANDYHFKIAHFEYIKEGNILLYVDHDAHEFVVLKTNKSTGNPLDAGVLAGMLDKEGMAATLQSLGSNQRKIVLDMPQSGIENVEVWYATKTYFITHTRLKIAANQAVVDIEYSQYKQQKQKNLPSINQFAVFKNKKFMPTDRFKNYKISIRG